MSGHADSMERRTVWVYPGQLVTAARPTVASTILATCVSVCLYDAKRGVGGMNHFLVARAAQRSGSCSLRSGDLATSQLLEGLLALGAERAWLQAKVFGGKEGAPGALGASIGKENTEVALQTLERERIPVVALDVGRSCSRKLVFHTDTGMAWVREF